MRDSIAFTPVSLLTQVSEVHCTYKRLDTLDGATYAAIPYFQPFLNRLAALIDSKGLLDIKSWGKVSNLQRDSS
jgi:hypothetical protein